MPILAYQNPEFTPAMRIISNISNGNPCVVTTTFAHGYLSGAIVRLNLPLGFGMQELNQQYAEISVLSPTTFSMPINTLFLTTFTTPAGYPNNSQSATTVNVGENGFLLNSAVQQVPNTAFNS